MSEETSSEMEELYESVISDSEPAEENKQVEEVQADVMPQGGFPSATVNAAPSKMLPKQDYACLHCPNAIWFLLDEGLHCFCGLMRCETCSTDAESAPLSCDGMLVEKES